MINAENKELSIQQILFVVKNHFLKLILSVVFFLFIGVIYLIVTRPIYTSTGSIIIESENNSMVSLFDMGNLGGGKNFLENEIEVLNSRTTLEGVIKSLYNSEKKDDLLFFGTKKFQDGFLTKIFRKALFFDNNNGYDGYNRELNEDFFNAKVEALRSLISITNLKNTDVLRVSVSSNDRNEAALIANTIINVYQKRDQDWASGEMNHLKNFLIQQLELKEIDLNNIEQKMKVFQETEHIYGLDNNSNLLLEQLTAIESDFYNTEAKKNILIERKKYFENQLSRDEKQFAERVANTLDVQLYSIRQELSSLEADYISTKSREDDSHPAVVKLKKKIDNLKIVLNIETKKYVSQGIGVANPIQYRQTIMDSVINFDVLISGYKSKLLEVKSLISKYEFELSSLPEKYLQFSRLQRDRVILDQTYSLMKQKLEESKINEASQLGKIRIIDPATPNLYRSAPSKKVVFIISILFGVLFGVAIIFVYDYLDSTVKSIEEIEKREIPILAIIPEIGSVDRKRKKKKGYKLNFNKQNFERRLLTNEDPKSPVSEAYRTLRTSLMYDDIKDQGKIMIISSPGAGEGKTTTVANLAITYANMGKKTLLVDGDLRKPVLHKMFKNTHNKGLTNFLSGAEDKIKNLYFDSGIENFSVMTSGTTPPNPSELLGSRNMQKFIEQVKKEFDIILIDTPPLIAVTDAFILAKFTSKFLLVIRASVTQKGALDRSLTNIKNMSLNITGAVFNGVNDSSTYGGGYYYNYYQAYYGEDNK